MTEKSCVFFQVDDDTILALGLHWVFKFSALGKKPVLTGSVLAFLSLLGTTTTIAYVPMVGFVMVT